jgi:hypothetical protein
MKIHVEDYDVESNVDMSAAANYTIETNASMIQLLSDKIYKNKIGAVCREIICNAVDSHAEAFNPDRVEIKLPSIFDQNFTVTDHGVGLSHKQIMKLYSTYGASTKNEGERANDFIGAFGIGSKSPFAYVKNHSFNVKSVKDGEVGYYVCFSAKGNNKIVPIFRDKTSEDNGVEITIPVLPNDVENFKKQVFQQCFCLRDRLTVNGIPFEEFYDIPEKTFSNDDVEIFNGKTSISPSCNYLAELGGVLYPIDISNIVISDELADKLSNELGLSSKISLSGFYASLSAGNTYIYKFKLGELEVVGSREELSYDFKTSLALTKKIIGHYCFILKDLQEQIDKCSSHFEACSTVETIIKNLGVQHSHTYTSNAKYNGEVLRTGVVFKKDEPFISSFASSDYTVYSFTPHSYMATKQLKNISNIQKSRELKIEFNQRCTPGQVDDQYYVLFNDNRMSMADIRIKLKAGSYYSGQIAKNYQVIIIRSLKASNQSDIFEAFKNEFVPLFKGIKVKYTSELFPKEKKEKTGNTNASVSYTTKTSVFVDAYIRADLATVFKSFDPKEFLEDCVTDSYGNPSCYNLGVSSLNYYYSSGENMMPGNSFNRLTLNCFGVNDLSPKEVELISKESRDIYYISVLEKIPSNDFFLFLAPVLALLNHYKFDDDLFVLNKSKIKSLTTRGYNCVPVHKFLIEHLRKEIPQIAQTQILPFIRLANSKRVYRSGAGKEIENVCDRFEADCSNLFAFSENKEISSYLRNSGKKVNEYGLVVADKTSINLCNHMVKQYPIVSEYTGVKNYHNSPLPVKQKMSIDTILKVIMFIPAIALGSANPTSDPDQYKDLRALRDEISEEIISKIAKEIDELYEELKAFVEDSYVTTLVKILTGHKLELVPSDYRLKPDNTISSTNFKFIGPHERVSSPKNVELIERYNLLDNMCKNFKNVFTTSPNNDTIKSC